MPGLPDGGSDSGTGDAVWQVRVSADNGTLEDGGLEGIAEATKEGKAVAQ